MRLEEEPFLDRLALIPNKCHEIRGLCSDLGAEPSIRHSEDMFLELDFSINVLKKVRH